MEVEQTGPDHQIFGILIKADLILGRSPLPTNILSDHLERLRDGSLAQHIPAADDSKRLAYQLTDKGVALRPVLRAMRDWWLKWRGRK